jgi:hypothetical protein
MLETGGGHPASRARPAASRLAAFLVAVLAAPRLHPARTGWRLASDDAAEDGSADDDWRQSLNVQVVRMMLTWVAMRGVANKRPASPADPADPAA